MGIADISKSFFIIFIFVAMIMFSVFAIGVKKLKEDWPKNKCSPSHMPFASMVGVDPKENFNQCMAEIQDSLMDSFLGPIKASVASMERVAQGTIDATNNFRKTASGLTSMVPSMQGQLFNVFGEFVIYLRKFTINLSSTIQKVMAIATVFMHYILGFKYTAQSMWCGTVGTTLRAMQYPLNKGAQKDAKCNDGLCDDDKEC